MLTYFLQRARFVRRGRGNVNLGNSIKRLLFEITHRPKKNPTIFEIFFIPFPTRTY